MNCGRCFDLLGDYLDGAISTDVRAALEAHVASCRSCGDLLDACLALPELARRVTDTQMPADAKDRLRRFLAERKARG